MNCELGSRQHTLASCLGWWIVKLIYSLANWFLKPLWNLFTVDFYPCFPFKSIFFSPIFRFWAVRQVPGHDELLADRSRWQTNICHTKENFGGNGEEQRGIFSTDKKGKHNCRFWETGAILGRVQLWQWVASTPWPNIGFWFPCSIWSTWASTTRSCTKTWTIFLVRKSMWVMKDRPGEEGGEEGRFCADSLCSFSFPLVCDQHEEVWQEAAREPGWPFWLRIV